MSFYGSGSHDVLDGQHRPEKGIIVVPLEWRATPFLFFL